MSRAEIHQGCKVLVKFYNLLSPKVTFTKLVKETKLCLLSYQVTNRPVNLLKDLTKSTC
jgi:hypothetical protein